MAENSRRGSFGLKRNKGFDGILNFLYKYYRTNNTFIDDQLFVRGKYDIKLNLDTIYFETDHSFSTVRLQAAKMLANDLIQVYLEDQINNNNKNKASNNNYPLKVDRKQNSINRINLRTVCWGALTIKCRHQGYR